MATMQTRVAKLFMNGASQAVRLPADFRFEGEQVYVTRDEQSGDVIISAKPGKKAWREFLQFVREIDESNDFMADRPMNQIPASQSVFEKVAPKTKRKS
jgi:antitoxin VapB